VAAVVVTTMFKKCEVCEHLDPDIDPDCWRCEGTGSGLALIFYQIEFASLDDPKLLRMRTSSWLE
jgi:hypothetical protein